MHILLFIYPVFIALVILASLFIFFKFIYSTHKIKITETSFNELMSILNIMIKTEIDLYENNVFNTKGSITNSNFENYYNDMCDSIINNISSDFFDKMSVYINKDAIVTFIARTVKTYLAGKITGTI